MSSSYRHLPIFGAPACRVFREQLISWLPVGAGVIPPAAASAKRREHLASDMATRMVSPLLMLLLAGASAFAPPRAAHALLRTSAAPKLSSIVMEDRVFALKIPLGDVRSWLGLGLAS